MFFTVATVALAFNLTAAGLLTAATALPGAVAMAASFTGMFIGQAVRTRMQPEVFRRWFLIAMIFLGLSPRARSSRSTAERPKVASAPSSIATRIPR